jgi:glycosyltransferase involved in cell wall biosynthesis
LHAGIPDIIIHGETGLLCEEHDVNSMVRNMKKMLEEPGLAKQMGQQSRSRIAANFTLDRHIQCISATIAAVINEKPGNRP